MNITLDNISFAYGSIDVLHGISQRAIAGGVTAVIGSNASGKTTLLRCAAGLLRPRAGRVLCGDHDASATRPRVLAQILAYVSQRPQISAAFSVAEVVRLGRFARSPDESAVANALGALEVDQLAGRPFRELSVGQQQRVAIARALAQVDADGALVLDEPLAPLDLRSADLCARLLRAHADGGGAVLISVHDLTMAAHLADDVWLLDQGRIVAAGAADEVLQADTLQSVYGVDFELLPRSSGGVAVLPCPGRILQ